MRDPTKDVFEERDALRAENARLLDCYKGSTYTVDVLIKDNARLREVLKHWDALIRHQYTGSSAAMSDMTECAQETAKLLYGDRPWSKVEVSAAMGDTE